MWTDVDCQRRSGRLSWKHRVVATACAILDGAACRVKLDWTEFRLKLYWSILPNRFPLFPFLPWSPFPLFHCPFWLYHHHHYLVLPPPLRYMPIIHD